MSAEVQTIPRKRATRDPAKLDPLLVGLIEFELALPCSDVNVGRSCDYGYFGAVH